jgi:hypothetical protein
VRIVYIVFLGMALYQVSAAQLKDVNVQFRMRGYCYAYSSIVDTTAPGGFGGSDNAAKSTRTKFPSITGLKFLLDTIEPTSFRSYENAIETPMTKKLLDKFKTLTEKDPQYKVIEDSLMVLMYPTYKGHTLYLINNTDSTQRYTGCDSRLNIIAQVKVDTGWAAIEYNPSSWCGNSYHQVYLKSKEYWSFAVPSYSGKIKSMLRYKLNDGSQTIYSNPIACSYNKEQLGKKQGHNATNIMDPYDE